MSGPELDDWSTVAAEGTDPHALATVAALLGDRAGRAALRAALEATVPNLLGTSRTLAATVLAPDVVRAPTPDQRASAARALASWAELGVRAVLRGDPAYPRRLEALASPPPLLAWRGEAPSCEAAAVAIVGARRATGYGRAVAAWLAEAAADAGVTVVSGGAVGIDAAAHDAVADRGTTVVLGCGHGVPYPRPHARPGGLFERVLDGGGTIISELLPRTEPRPGHVRARNRIVAGLTDVVVVVEGGATSGALVTAGEAADAGVDVLAVPGDVRVPGSAAPHRLLREGAGVCTGPQDLLAALGTAAARGAAVGGGGDGEAAPVGVVTSVLPASLHEQLRASWPRPVSPSALARRSGLSVGAVLAAVTRARVAGEVADGVDGVRLSRAPHTERGGHGPR